MGRLPVLRPGISTLGMICLPVPGSFGSRLDDSFTSRSIRLRILYPLENPSLGGSRKALKETTGSWKLSELSAEIVWHLKSFYIIKEIPCATLSGMLHDSHATWLHQPSVNEAIDPGFVSSGPIALRVARRNPEHCAQFVKLSREAINPSKAQALIDDFFVTQVWVTRILPPGHYPNTAARGMVMS